MLLAAFAPVCPIVYIRLKMKTSMKVKAIFFASCRDIVGSRELELDFAEGFSVGDLKRDLVAQYPRLAAIYKVLSIAVNAEYVDDDVLLKPGDEVAFIPPVSGG